MNVSTIPAPVAAEISGFGSFFGSCQIAAGGFESFLQSVSAAYGTSLNIETPDSHIEVPEFMNALDGYEAFKGPKLLERLQEILGEEAGAEAFEFIKDFFEEYKEKFTAPKGVAPYIAQEPSEIMRVFFRLLEILDPKQMSEALPKERQVELLEGILKDIKKLLGYEQIAQPEEGELTQSEENVLTQTLIQPEEEVLPQPEAEIPQPKVEMPQSKVETAQQKTAQKVPINMIAFPLAVKLGIAKWEERKEFSDMEFYDFIENLLEQGLVNLDDLGKYLEEEGVLLILEEGKLDYFEETLKNLWESVKSGDKPQQEELSSILKEIATGKELGKQLKESMEVEQKAEILDSTSKKENGFKKDFFKEDGLNPANLVKIKYAEGKQEKLVQPEVRAVWEGNGMKIEIVNPKTGEKLESVPTTGNTQERVNEYEVIRQVVARAKFITTPTGEQKFTIQLRPEHLGQLDLRITLNRGEMQIHARVESAVAQQALENHIGLLREGLEKQGITLERLEISIEQKDRQDAWSLAEKHEKHEQKHGQRHNHRGRESHLAVSIANENADTGRRLGYNTMEYLA